MGMVEANINNKKEIEVKLTNRDISEKHRDEECWFMRSDFLGAFAYWAVAQSPYDTPDILSPLQSFGKYVSERVADGQPEKFTYDELSDFISEKVFESIPEIEALNHPKVSSGVGYDKRHETRKFNPDYDFIDLGALARNVFYMMLRQSITQA